MDIQQPQTQNAARGAGEQAGRPREGETVRVQVSERLSDQEAKVKIRGQETRVRFEGGVPSSDSARVEVKGSKEGTLHVREVQGDRSGSGRSGAEEARRSQAEVQRELRRLGIEQPSRETVRAARAFMDRGVRMDERTAADLQRYMERGPGTVRERMQTVQQAADRQLQPSQAQLQSMHRAVHGESTADRIQQTASGGSRDSYAEAVRMIEQVRADQQRGRPAEASIQQARDMISRQPAESQERLMRELQTVQAAAGRQTASGQTIQQAASMLRTAMEQGNGLRQAVQGIQESSRQSTPEIQRTVNDHLRQMLQAQAQGGRQQALPVIDRLEQSLRSTASGSPETSVQGRPAGGQQTGSSLVQQWQQSVQLQPDLRQSLDQIRQELPNQPAPVREVMEQRLPVIEQQLDQGRELQARRETASALEQVRPLMNTQQQAENTSRAAAAAEVKEALGSSARQVLITEVTERLARATDTFREFQRSTVQQLSRMDQLLQQSRTQQQTQVQIRPMLENTIQQLDRAVSKSDWLLYADMKQERQLLGAGTRLGEARDMLQQGRTSEAQQIVREVARTLDQMQYRPSHQRIQHMSMEQNRVEDARPQQQIQRQYDAAARMLTHNDHSGRQVMEGMRMLGMTREADLAQMLAQGKQISEQQQRDVRSMLMQFSRGGDDESRQQAQQTVQQMNGGQLQQRQDPAQQMQFQLPMQLRGENEELKVYMQNKGKQGGMDWENMNLFFHIDTPSLGPLGIALQASERNLSIQLKNDTDGFEDMVLPLTGKYMEALEQAGYRVQNIDAGAYTSEVEDVVETAAPEPVRAIMTEKGFDYKV
ncbi:hypothetical protein [Alkalicoccus chagannorensis]|uniref:hypothetical protein n=1 Tax=Alkalicoccus chagannorensis TaxID=427072 RepID=UPI000418AB9C|nr:hypothetical protein [Alkalicoccus chagannorensis]